MERSIKWYRRGQPVIIGLLSLATACGSIVVRVGKAEKPRPEFEPSTLSNPDPLGMKTLDSWLAKFDKLKTEDKAKVLIQEMKQGLRYHLRQALGSLETAVKEEALRPGSESDELAPGETQNGVDDPIAVFESDTMPWLAVLTDGEQLLLPADGESEQTPLDEVVVGLFYDFGIHVRGQWSTHTDEAGTRQQLSDIYWRIVPERHEGEAQEELARSASGVRLQVVRTSQGSQGQHLSIDVMVAPGLYEGTAADSDFAKFLHLDLTYQTANLEQPIFAAHYQAGKRRVDGTARRLHYSRRLELFKLGESGGDDEPLEGFEIRTGWTRYDLDQKAGSVYRWDAIEQTLTRLK